MKNISLKEIPMTEELLAEVKKVAVEQLNIDAAAIEDLSGANASQIVEGLNVITLQENIIQLDDATYVLATRYGQQNLETGTIYNTFMRMNGNADERGAWDANSMDDFNGTMDGALRQLWKVDQKWHKKIKLTNVNITDSTVLALSLVKLVAEFVKNFEYAYAKAMENEYWAQLFAKAVIVDVDAVAEQEDAITLAKAMDLQFRKWGTTARKHLGVGTDGSVTITDTVLGDVTYSPEKRFTSDEFVVVTTPEYGNTITFEADAVYFNWGTTKRNFKAGFELDFDLYSGFEAIYADDGTTVTKEAITPTEGTAIILLHDEAMKGYKWFDYSKELEGASAFSVRHAFSEYGVNVLPDLPIVIFRITPEAPAGEEEVVETKAKKAKAVEPVLPETEEVVEETVNEEEVVEEAK